MKIGLAFRNELMGIPGGTWIVEQFDQLVAGINGVWKIEHNDNGTHRHVTAETVTVSEQVQTPEVLIGNADATGISLKASAGVLQVLDGTGVSTARADILADTLRLSGGALRFGSTIDGSSARILRNGTALDFVAGFTSTTPATINAGPVNGTTGTFSTAVVVGTADTNGARLDLESGSLAVREGDDSDYAPLKALTLTTTGLIQSDANIQITTNNTYFRAKNTGATQYNLIGVNGSNQVSVDPDARGVVCGGTVSVTGATVTAPAFKTSTALVTATDGASTAAFTANMVGATGGPTTAAQHGWLKMQDSAGATVWVPVWK